MDLAQCPARRLPCERSRHHQPHSSDDDNVHSATVVDESDQDHPAKRVAWCIARIVGVPLLSGSVGVDECALEQRGPAAGDTCREDNLIVDLENPDDTAPFCLTRRASTACRSSDTWLLGWFRRPEREDPGQPLIKFPLRTPLGEPSFQRHLERGRRARPYNVSHRMPSPDCRPETAICLRQQRAARRQQPAQR